MNYAANKRKPKMNYAAATLLVWCCLLTPFGSKAQAPIVVLLDSGEVARHDYVAFRLPAYQQLLAERRADSVALALGAAAQAQSTALIATQAAQVRAQRQQLETGAADYARLSAKTDRALALPLRPPLLADTRLYAGGLLGALAAALLYVYLHP